MENFLEKGISDQEKNDFQKRLEEDYNWNTIAEQTIEVYNKAIQ